MIPLLLATSAWAYDITFCVEFDSNLNDIGGGEDYWTTNGDKAARGVYISVIRNSDSAEMYSTHWVADTGASEGCATVSGLSSTTTYDVTYTSKAKVHDVELRSYDDDVTPLLRTYKLWDDYHPVVNATVTADVPATDDRDQVLMVATWAMYRGVVGGIGGTPLINFYGMSSGCGASGGGDVWIASACVLKFAIGHEIGHTIGYLRDESTGSSNDLLAAEDNCDGEHRSGNTAHSLTSKEYQSTAAVEGWADFYSANLWNDATTSDCTYVRHYPTDFDLDSTDDTPLDNSSSCEGVPVSGLPSYVSADDWLEDLVNAADAGGCTGTLSNRGAQYDWLRFFWDMRTDQALTLGNLAVLWDDMDPRTFDPDDTTGGDDPDDLAVARLVTACSGVYESDDISAACSAEDSNGQDH